jgi:carboxypeptidase T
MEGAAGRPAPRLGRSWAAAALALVLALALLGLAAPPAHAGKPGGYDHLLTPAELEAWLDRRAADYPGIVHKFSIGTSHQGRAIWGVRIGDDEVADGSEPEIVITGQVHAREWISQTMALHVIELLTEGYASDPRVRSIVRHRQVYVIPTLNPDGAAFDIEDGTFRRWRKNRQPIPGSDHVGVDLNRNFGYRWGCCGGGSDNPANEKYRGWKAWVAPEAQALRDFVNSRVIGGRQRIAATLTFHSAGEMVLWPYAYTRTAVPRTMSADDQRAFVALGREMARLNGYRPMQGSRLYVVDGDHDDWMYNRHRIFAMTFELAAFEKRYYPTAAEAATETTRNREAVLYFLEQADCPHRAAGLGVTHCGPLNDDFETGRGWRVNPFGSDTATGGRFARGVPQRTANRAGVKQRAATPSGEAAFVTGLAAGANLNANDVDGGVTSVASPAFTLGSGSGWRVALRYTFAHNAKASGADFFRVSVIDGTTRTVVFSQAGAAANRNAIWSAITRSLDAFAGRTVRLLFEAADNGPDSLIEAAFDDVRVYRLP